jgi:glycine hydroxymethyltransferase
MHVISAKAACFKEALDSKFKTYCVNVVNNCKMIEKGLSARGVKMVSGGTDNHLLLIDLSDSEITGKDLENRLYEVNITANKNAIPNEKRSPFVTSGVRIGTAAITSRGMGEKEMESIAEFLYLAISDFENNKSYVKSAVEDMCRRYPIYK